MKKNYRKPAKFLLSLIFGCKPITVMVDLNSKLNRYHRKKHEIMSLLTVSTHVTQICIHKFYFLFFFLDSRKCRYIYYVIYKTTTNDNNISLFLLSSHMNVWYSLRLYYIMLSTCEYQQYIQLSHVQCVKSVFFQTATCVLRFIQISLQLSNR